MGVCSAILIATLCLQFASSVSAMQCEIGMGVNMNCPLPFVNDDDDVFCCHSDKVPYCCNLGEYMKQNTVILAGILVGAVVILIILTLCCCCFCSCCCLAKRRVQRGTILAAPVQVTPAAAPLLPQAYPLTSNVVVHSPPTHPGFGFNYPPPYPHDNFQPPENPNYKS